VTLLPSIDDLVRTPPPWKSPYLVHTTEYSSTFSLTTAFSNTTSLVAQTNVTSQESNSLDASDSTSAGSELQLPISVCGSKPVDASPVKTPTKTPGRVAQIFGQLLPITPRKKSQKRLRKFVRRGTQAMCRMATAIGLKAPVREFKTLADLRRILLQKHRSLHKAFRELENRLKQIQHQEGTAWKKSKSGNRPTITSMDMMEFTRAIGFCGIDAQEAHYFFELMDTNGDGFITMEEFKTSLVTMPREVLLQHFRKRLLTKYSTTHEAFKALSQAPGNRDPAVAGDLSQPLTREVFAFRLSRLGIEEQEASLLFDMMDTDASHTISLFELREGVREVAPPVSLEEFWHRFHTRWPNIRAEASSGAMGRRSAAALLFKTLPAKYRGSSLDMPVGLSLEAWTILSEELDVPRTNAEAIFQQCATAKIWQGHRAPLPGSLEGPQSECDLDDFFDELLLWSQTPKARQGPEMRQSYSVDVAQRLHGICRVR
jgi:hypothetical protein